MDDARVQVRDRQGVGITRVDPKTCERLIAAGAEWSGQQRRRYLRVPIDWAAYLETKYAIEDARSAQEPNIRPWKHITVGPRPERRDALLLKALLAKRRPFAARLDSAFVVDPDTGTRKPLRVWQFFEAEPFAEEAKRRAELKARLGPEKTENEET